MTREQYKKIKETKKLYQSIIDPWIARLEEARNDLALENFALDEWGAMLDPKQIDNIISDANLAKKCIKWWEMSRDEKIKSILDDKELELDIERVFGKGGNEPK